MSAGRGPQGQLHTEGAGAVGQSTRRERSQGTGGESSTQHQCEGAAAITRVQGHDQQQCSVWQSEEQNSLVVIMWCLNTYIMCTVLHRFSIPILFLG